MIDRIIGNIPRRNSIKPLCKTLNLLRFPDIYIYSVGIFMYYYTNSLLPETFQNLFTENRQIHHYPTRNRDQLRPPRTRTRHADNFISKQGVIIWNNLKSNMDTYTSLPIFKRNLKKLLLSAY